MLQRPFNIKGPSAKLDWTEEIGKYICFPQFLYSWECSGEEAQICSWADFEQTLQIPPSLQCHHLNKEADVQLFPTRLETYDINHIRIRKFCYSSKKLKFRVGYTNQCFVDIKWDPI